MLAGVGEPNDRGEQNNQHNSLHAKAEDERICQLGRHPHGGQRQDQGSRTDKSPGAIHILCILLVAQERECVSGALAQ